MAPLVISMKPPIPVPMSTPTRKLSSFAMSNPESVSAMPDAATASCEKRAMRCAGELGRQLFGRVAAVNGARTAATLDQAVPVLVKRFAERVDGPHAGHHDTRPTIRFQFPTSDRILPTS